MQSGWLELILSATGGSARPERTGARLLCVHRASESVAGSTNIAHRSRPPSTDIPTTSPFIGYCARCGQSITEYSGESLIDVDQRGPNDRSTEYVIRERRRQHIDHEWIGGCWTIGRKHERASVPRLCTSAWRAGRRLSRRKRARHRGLGSGWASRKAHSRCRGITGISGATGPSSDRVSRSTSSSRASWSTKWSWAAARRTWKS